MENDNYGNCVIATAGHALLNWRANELNDLQRITDAAVIDLSRTMGALQGYNILLTALNIGERTACGTTKFGRTLS